jgi:D-sedoheptulose 7-phosphate isomerase
MSTAKPMFADLFQSEIRHHLDVVAASLSLGDDFARLAEACIKALRQGGKLLLFGNGGSAADAQHIAAELVVRFQAHRRALPAMALTTDSSVLTAIGNDFGFDQIFARQIEALARHGDVVIGISTSGTSENVLLGLRAASARACVAAGLSGRGGGRMVGLADPLVIAPSDVTARAQEVHILIGHVLCLAIERDLASWRD